MGQDTAMESLGMKLFGNCYRGRKVLLTGHTGFKGSWLALWLNALGAKTTGLALDPSSDPAHWDLLNLPIDDRRADIRNTETVVQIMQETKPEIVFHLAAQPLVRRSYRDPIDTWLTNVMGTANILDACRREPSVRAIVVITTDKCYENQEWEWGYRENDRLGGHDPYSASKAAAELVVSSYRAAFFHSHDAPLLASARAGNVIGGGDWSEDRLIPDLVRAVQRNEDLEIRSPNATRPWQHVLESLSGYLSLGQKLVEGKREFADAWNFGPDVEGNRTVKEVLSKLKLDWPKLEWHTNNGTQPHEAKLLHLDSSKARQRLAWQPVWSLDEGLHATASWYRTFMETEFVKSSEQLDAYIESATKAGLAWTQG
jgi:CDP-glucose 4,6-dehydratase